MATQIRNLPEQPVLDTSRWECVNGKLLERAVPNFTHSELQFQITLLIRNADQTLGIQANQEFSIDRTDDKQSDWMTPDVLVSHPGGFRLKAGGHALPPALLAVEVLSPGQNFFNMRSKAQDYLAWGVATVWLVDPDSSTALVFESDSPEQGKLIYSGALRAGEVNLELSQIFS